MEAHPGYIDGLKGESASLRIQIDYLEAVVAMMGQSALEEMRRAGMCTTEVGYINEPHKFGEDLNKLVTCYLLDQAGHRHGAEQAVNREKIVEAVKKVLPDWLKKDVSDDQHIL